MASGVCGSDVMEWYRIKKAPRVLGHEIAGEIAQVGADVKGFSVGDRVFVTHHVPCNQCRYCLTGAHSACQTLQSTNFDPGGFAEYVRVPEINVHNGTFHMPQHVTMTRNVYRTAGSVIRGPERRVGKGDTVLASIRIAGLLHIKMARVYGGEGHRHRYQFLSP
jgi:L-iditol 2-dehydrogenase